MEVPQDWAAVEGHRYHAYCDLVLALCRTPASDPTYPELQGRCRDAAQRWQEAYRLLHASRGRAVGDGQRDHQADSVMPPVVAGERVEAAVQ